MNSKSVIVISVVAVSLVILSGIAVSEPINKFYHSYKEGNEEVVFQGNQSFVSIGHNNEKVSWVVEQVESNTTKIVHFPNYKARRITNAYQNSAILLENSSIVSIAEIFTFENNKIDASAALMNHLHVNSTFIVVFTLETINTNGNLNTGIHSYVLPSSYSTVTVGSLQVSWGKEMALFHSGIETTNGINTIITLPFGPITLVQNETYSIDPTITGGVDIPVRSSISAGLINLQGTVATQTVAKPMYIPDGDGDGDPCHCDNDGGGGTSGSPPQMSSFSTSSYNDTIAGTTSIQLQVYVSSLGSGGDYLDVYVENSNNQEIQLHSWSATYVGTYSYTWSASQGVYQYFVAYVHNSYGGAQNTAGHGFNVYTKFPYQNSASQYVNPEESQTSTVFEWSGTAVGYLTLTMYAPFDTPIQGGTYHTEFATSFLRLDPNSSYEVNWYSQTFQWTGNTAGDTPSSSPGDAWTSNHVLDESYQNVINGTWLVIEKILYGALQAAAGTFDFPVSLILSSLNPLYFEEMAQSSYPSGADSIGVSHSGGVGVVKGVAYYPPLGVQDGLGFKPSYMFDFNDSFNFAIPVTGYTQSSAILNYFTYSAGYGITDGQLGLVNSTVSESIYIAQY